LSHFAEEIGNGNLDQEIKIETNDEIGHLARTFSIMASKLKMTMGTLENRMIDLHHSEELLKKSEKKYRNIFENALEGIYQVGYDGRIISVNPAGAEMLGYNSESEMKLHLNHQMAGVYADPADREVLLKIINEKHQVTDYEMRLIRKDKKIIDVAVSVRGIFDSNRQLVMLGGFIQNIMVRKQKEAAEREIVAAKAANEAKSTFLATMSHEIRTPLNAVAGFSELLSSLVTDEKQKSYLSAIKCSGDNLLLLINDILDLSKIEAGRLELQYSPVDLRILLKEVEQVFILQVQKKAIQFFVNISNEIPEILYLDKLRLRQILINVVGNAIKFTNKGFVKLSVDVLNQKDDSRLDVHIKVEDTGIGISEEDIGTIFDSFKQPTNQDSSRYKGTGLGLAICKRLVEMMNGQIDVESVAGQGSTFTIIINDVKSKTKHRPAVNLDEQKKGSKKRETADEWKTLSSKTLSKVPELIRILDSEYLDQWNKFAKRQPIQEVEKFGKDLRDLGLEFKINPLIDYGERLLIYVDNFDVAGMLIMIDEFTFLMSQLKAINKENS
ncbi:MAG: PAS domain S-box protein, partial [Desulfobacteraceae bacterium]|nr:PAS domain S-box protein [Desulfobacteraceae bacterium]